jgi:hypothetical protein
MAPARNKACAKTLTNTRESRHFAARQAQGSSSEASGKFHVLVAKEEYVMKKFALVLAAAACLLIAPAVVQSTSAETYVRSSSDWWGSSATRSRAQVVVGGSNCRMVTTKIKRNGKVIIRKVRKCG